MALGQVPWDVVRQHGADHADAVVEVVGCDGRLDQWALGAVAADEEAQLGVLLAREGEEGDEEVGA